MKAGMGEVDLEALVEVNLEDLEAEVVHLEAPLVVPMQEVEDLAAVPLAFTEVAWVGVVSEDLELVDLEAVLTEEAWVGVVTD